MKKISLILLLAMASAMQNSFAKKGEKEKAVVSLDVVFEDSEKSGDKRTPKVAELANEELFEGESEDEDFAIIVDASKLENLDDNLFDEIKKNKIEDVKSYLDSGAAVENKNKDGLTPLLFAMANNADSAIVQELLKRKADVDAKDHNGTTALMMAAHFGRTDLVWAMFEHANHSSSDARLNWLNAQDAEGRTALMLAALAGQDTAVGRLIFLGANPDLKDSSGETALMHAIRRDHLNVVYILSRYSSVDTQNDYGDTALMIAVKLNNFDIVKALLNNDANVNLQNKFGETALTIAVRQNNYELVRALLDAGAQIFFDSTDRFNAFDFARKNPKMSELLLEYIPDADQVGIDDVYVGK